MTASAVTEAMRARRATPTTAAIRRGTFGLPRRRSRPRRARTSASVATARDPPFVRWDEARRETGGPPFRPPFREALREREPLCREKWSRAAATCSGRSRPRRVPSATGNRASSHRTTADVGTPSSRARSFGVRGKGVPEVCPSGWDDAPALHRRGCRAVPGAREVSSAELAVEIVGRTDEREVRERLREVPEQLARRPDFLGEQPNVVRVREHLLEGEPGLVDPACA